MQNAQQRFSQDSVRSTPLARSLSASTLLLDLSLSAAGLPPRSPLLQRLDEAEKRTRGRSVSDLGFPFCCLAIAELRRD